MWWASSLKTASFFDFANDFTKIGLAVGGLADWLRAERIEEVVAQVLVFERRVGHFAEIDAMDVREKEIAGVADYANVVLNVERELEIVAPVASFVAIAGQDRVVKENTESIEVGSQAVENNDVRRDDEEVARKRGVRFVELMEEAPSDKQREDFRSSGACRHFQNVARPIFVEHASGNRAGSIEAEQVKFVASALNLMEPK